MKYQCSFFKPAACTTYVGMMAGIATGAFITSAKNTDGREILIGLISGIIVGAIAGVCWFKCSNRTDDDNETSVLVNEGDYNEDSPRNLYHAIEKSAIPTAGRR